MPYDAGTILIPLFKTEGETEAQKNEVGGQGLAEQNIRGASLAQAGLREGLGWDVMFCHLAIVLTAQIDSLKVSDEKTSH